VDEVAETLEHLRRKQFQERCGFAAGDNKAVDMVEVFGFADERDRRPKFFEAAAMGIKIALECEDTDFHEQLVASS
jgi:hypothetical protein